MLRPYHTVSNIQRFLGHTLPPSDQNHTLALGESHLHSEHLAWLSQNLPALVASNNLAIIGLEETAYLNLFLWAYQDGTLERKLGSKDAARNYVRAIFVANSKSVFRENAEATSHLAMQAIDLGVQVIAYDSRHTTRTEQERLSAKTRKLNTQLSTEMRDMKMATLDQVRQYIRTHKSELQHYSVDEHKLKAAWLMGEVEWLMAQQSANTNKLQAVEHLIHVGHEKINEGKIGTDALNACILEALATSTGNRIALCGLQHLDGIGSAPTDNDTIQGRFAEHLFSLSESPTPHKVSIAVLAGTGMLQRLDQELGKQSHPFTVVNLDSGHITAANTTPALQAANPLLLPELKAGYESVRQTIQGPQAGRPR